MGKNIKTLFKIIKANKIVDILRKIRRSLYGEKLTKKYKLKNFFQDFHVFNSLDINKRFSVLKEDIYPCLEDNSPHTSFDPHYIYHPAWAARIVKRINPDLHTDISSILNFCSILSAFVDVDFYDYRPAVLNLKNLRSRQADLTALPFLSNSLASISCMHTIEHIGLGRYGDPLDPEGDLKAINELKRVCTVNGNLLIVVPVGLKKIQFNAHRVYDPFDIIEYMSGFELRDFSLIDDNGCFTENADLTVASTQKYGCGCYWFVKKPN